MHVFLRIVKYRITSYNVCYTKLLRKETAYNIRSAFPNADIYNVYGLTEASPRVAYLPPEYFNQYPESVGIPLNFTKIKVIDMDSGIEHVITSYSIHYTKLYDAYDLIYIFPKWTTYYAKKNGRNNSAAQCKGTANDKVWWNNEES